MTSVEHPGMTIETWTPEVAVARLKDPANLPDIIVLWDSELDRVSENNIREFVESNDDAWTISFRGEDEPDLLRYAEPLQVYRLVPDPDVDRAVTWRLDPRATFLRGSTVRALGGIERGFSTLAGALREMGLRWLVGGAVMRQRSSSLPAMAASQIPLADRYRLLYLRRSQIWVRYALARRLARIALPHDDLRAFRDALAGGRAAIAKGRLPARNWSSGGIPDARVTIVLPTFGRYRYVEEVLEDIRAQTVRPHQILVADGNAPRDREPAIYERFSDLPIEVLWIEQPGTCLPRNECLTRATGDFVWFIDDDSRFAPDNLEAHLRVLREYGADVSVGPAFTQARPELHADQSFVRCSWMDCGTTVVRHELLARVGGFDLQFNERLAGEDGELGIRFIRSGALMVSNPHAKRFHYLAPVGGARASINNIHRWRRLSLLPRPSQSIYYTGVRHFERSAALEAVAHMWVVLGWRRAEGTASSLGWKATTLSSELLALPISVARLVRSIAIGSRMAQEGPLIPEIERPKL